MPGKVTCLECGAVLISVHRHDFKKCDCPNGAIVDGGDEYLRTGGKDMSKVKSEMVPLDPDQPGYDHAIVDSIRFWHAGDGRFIALAEFDPAHLLNIIPILADRKSKWHGAAMFEAKKRGLGDRRQIFEDFYAGAFPNEVTTHISNELITTRLSDRGWHLVDSLMAVQNQINYNDVRKWTWENVAGTWFNNMVFKPGEFWFELEEDAVAFSMKAGDWASPVRVDT